MRSPLRNFLAANTTVSISDLKDPNLWLVNSFGGQKTASGQTVTPETALTISSYYLGLRAISEDVGKLPLKTYERLEPRGKRVARDNPLFRLLHDAPNREMSAMVFRETMTHHAVGWGNAYAEINRDKRDIVRELWPIHPSRVTVERSRETKKIVYTARTNEGKVVPFKERDMFHIHGLGSNGMMGYTAIHLARESLGMTMAAERAGASFFGKGMMASGVLEHPETMGDEALRSLRSQFAEEYGGVDNSGKPLILEEGAKWTSLDINPKDAQFLETRQFQVEEVARWLRMPPHKLMHLIRTSGIQTGEMNVQYLVDTLQPWLVRWEQEISRKLVPAAEQDRIFAEHLVKGILRGDLKAQGQWYKTMFMIGAMSPNDIRECENVNPYDGGDEYFVPTNMAKAEDVAEGKFAKTNKGPTGEIGNADGNGRPERGTENAEHIRPLFVDAAERCLKREVRAAESAFKRCAKDADERDDVKFQKWLATFYVDQERYWQSAFSPLVDALVLTTSDEPWHPDVDSWAMGQVAESINALKTKWQEGDFDASVLVDRSELAAGALFTLCTEREHDASIAS